MELFMGKIKNKKSVVIIAVALILVIVLTGLTYHKLGRSEDESAMTKEKYSQIYDVIMRKESKSIFDLFRSATEKSSSSVDMAATNEMSMGAATEAAESSYAEDRKSVV